MFKVGDIVYIPDTDYIIVNRRRWIHANIARITKVEFKRCGSPWYSFEMLNADSGHKYFHTGYDYNNLADTTWIKVDKLETVQILYGKK